MAAEITGARAPELDRLASERDGWRFLFERLALLSTDEQLAELVRWAREQDQWVPDAV